MPAPHPASRSPRTAVLLALGVVMVTVMAGALVVVARQVAHPRPLLDVALVDPPARGATVPAGTRGGRADPADPDGPDGPAGPGLPVVDPGWLRTTAAAAGLPEPALRAYARAQLAAPASCHLGWTTLAGVGWIESHHGTLGGRTLRADGRSSTPVVGPALDGTGHVAAIAATPASTAMHGDPRWDHAVGPMQFLPSTWGTWGADGDGDGTADPDDLDDAALAAAHYLCAGGRDLATATGWTSAVLSYNHSAAYVGDVHDAATAYARRTS